jgi:hypothetical protein
MTLKLLRVIPLMMTLAAPALAGDAPADGKDAHAKEHAKEHAKKSEPKKDAEKKSEKKAPGQDDKAK